MKGREMTFPVLANAKRPNRFKNKEYADLIPEIPKNFAVEVNEENDETVLTIYGDIGESWWYESTSANDVDRVLKQVKTSNITVRLNSPGGDAFDGITIYNRLKDHDAQVTIIVDGWACSAASIIAMAADKLIMNTGAMLMVHEAWTVVIGSKSDMQKQADMMTKLDESLLDIYMTKAQVTRDEMKQLVDNETWFTADETIAIGFANAKEEVEEPVNNKNDPESFKQSVLQRLMTKEKEPIQQQATTVLSRLQRNSK